MANVDTRPDLTEEGTHRGMDGVGGGNSGGGNSGGGAGAGAGPQIWDPAGLGPILRARSSWLVIGSHAWCSMDSRTLFEQTCERDRVYRQFVMIAADPNMYHPWLGMSPYDLPSTAARLGSIPVPPCEPTIDAFLTVAFNSDDADSFNAMRHLYHLIMPEQANIVSWLVRSLGISPTSDHVIWLSRQSIKFALVLYANERHLDFAALRIYCVLCIMHSLPEVRNVCK